MQITWRLINLVPGRYVRVYRERGIPVRIALAAVAAYAALAVMTSHAGPLAPAPEVIAEYDRKFIERSGAQTLEELLDTGIIRLGLRGRG